MGMLFSRENVLCFWYLLGFHIITRNVYVECLPLVSVIRPYQNNPIFKLINMYFDDFNTVSRPSFCILKLLYKISQVEVGVSIIFQLGIVKVPLK